MIDLYLDPELYQRLRYLAARIHGERGGGALTLQPTALLHEAWEKVARSSRTYDDRAHFFAVAAVAMRQVLIDHARAQRTARRDGGDRTTLSGVGDAPELDVLDLDAALTALEALDVSSARVAMLRTFGGMSVAEIAEASRRPVAVVERDWTFARAWLRVRLGEGV